MENEIDSSTVLKYYKYMTLQLAFDLSPIAVLVTTLITFGLMSQRNEVTAARSLGVSVYRLAVPVLIGASIVAACAAVLQMRILPASNEVATRLEDQIMGREGSRLYRRADRQWLFGHGRYIYNYLHYDENRTRLDRLQVFEFGDDFGLRRRLFSSSAHYGADEDWQFDNTWVRSFDRQTLLDYQRYRDPVVIDFPETPAYFEEDEQLPRAMSFSELRRYIEQLKESGRAEPTLSVELQKKVAMPALAVIMALVALPFSFRLGRRGALYGVGIGILLGLSFIILFTFFSTLGEIAILPAAVAVWSPSLLFALFSLYLFLGVKS